MLKEFVLEEGYPEAKAKWGEESAQTLDAFKELVKKNQFSGDEKNIDWWVKNKSLADMKTAIAKKAEEGSKTKVKKEANLKGVDGATLVNTIDGYEVWRITSYEAAKHMGRFYKNCSASWCISTDNKEHWNNYTKLGDYFSTFYFLIRVNKKKTFNNELDRFAKIALSHTRYNDEFYDLTDEVYTTDELISQSVSEKLIRFALKLAKKDLDAKIARLEASGKFFGELNIESVEDVKTTLKKAKKVLGDMNVIRIAEYFNFEGSTITDVSGVFYVGSCKKLLSLVGAPKKAETVEIEQCDNLESLEGIPQANHISVMLCKNLKSLFGLKAPKQYKHEITNCPNLLDWGGAPEGKEHTWYVNHEEMKKVIEKNLKKMNKKTISELAEGLM